MAVRYCLAQGMAPCLEVVIASASDLSDAPEVLTDLDVVGLEFIADGGMRRLLFDCKTTNKMSAINRAFWASGILAYTGCDEAFVILKNRTVYNHRLSALAIGVDLHDEASFEDLGGTRDITLTKTTIINLRSIDGIQFTTLIKDAVGRSHFLRLDAMQPPLVSSHGASSEK